MTLYNLFRSYHLRIIRFFQHFLQWIPVVKKNHLPSKNLLEWCGDLLFYILDLILIPELIEILMVFVQPKLRFLNSREKEYIQKYFKNKVLMDNIRISYWIPKWIENLAIAFVTFNTVHYSKRISLPIFIHEIVHVWQYQKFGSVYIYRALKAQYSSEGYNYGGLENLYSKMLSNFIFTDFNFEQQGEIFEDYCRLKESIDTGNPIAEASYEYFVAQVRGSEMT